jgi:signal transduction histidine kinase
MRLDKIVKDFLNLARPSKPTLVPMQADSTLREVKDLLAPQCKRQAIELKCDYMDSALFCADPQQLKQVLINLVQNAADSIGQDGTITMRARRGKARLNGGPADAVVLEVEDTGPGIPLEVQERLFDPFFSTKTDGTGLGLPIAARIIDKHGGNLDFESEAGRGTIFRVTLPVHQPA